MKKMVKKCCICGIKKSQVYGEIWHSFIKNNKKYWVCEKCLKKSTTFTR